jgi:hypothetical protein
LFWRPSSCAGDNATGVCAFLLCCIACPWLCLLRLADGNGV